MNNTDQNKHTPGPWILGGAPSMSYLCEDNGAWSITDAAGEFVIASRNQCEHRRDQMIANAHLISAAPALLEAVQAFVSYDEGVDDSEIDMMLTYASAIRLAHAAINKATGQ